MKRSNELYFVEKEMLRGVSLKCCCECLSCFTGKDIPIILETWDHEGGQL